MSDAKEVAQEFKQKIQRIVARDKEDNFFLRLYKGRALVLDQSRRDSHGTPRPACCRLHDMERASEIMLLLWKIIMKKPCQKSLLDAK